MHVLRIHKIPECKAMLLPIGNAHTNPVGFIVNKSARVEVEFNLHSLYKVVKYIKVLEDLIIRYPTSKLVNLI